MTDLEAKILGPVAGAPPRVRIRYRGEPPSENWAQQLSFWIYPKLGIPWIGRLCGFLQEPCVLYVAPFPDRAWREIARSTVCNGSTPQLDRVTLGVMHAHSAYRRTFHLIT